MKYSTEEILELNMDRERKHKGEKFVCQKCGCGGVVGEDLVAAYSTTTQGSAWSWWVHESCAKEHTEKNLQ